ncbi:MAG: exodeoxyribonuclease VII small subunit [Desulfobacterales bacterium]|nr:exodeoxyribonuclease VII small subunit [Desulfobacterales bacterium]MDJ0914499.1 exodeoxyribonuclease VII small subunit [Desulfobacterales bacterium]
MATKTFEKAMEQLEKIVQELEHGDLPIEKALRKFEEGVKLSQFCTNKLNETEQKVSLLLKNPDETIREEVFNDENDT